MPDNPNAFKHQVNIAIAQRLADGLKKAWPAFDREGFLKEIKAGLEPLELKARIAFASDAMAKRLPEDYPKALGIVLKTLGPALDGTKGAAQDLFYHWIHAYFVETRGLNHFDQSLDAMVEITKRSTSEFAVRPFLLKDPARVLNFLERLICDPNPHVRRWISEGTRPLLPWGKRIPAFVADPRPALKLITRLRKDESLYVRNSVANHLNDISKNQPDLAVETAGRWMREGFPESEWIARRALRDLVKKGHAGALKVLGFSAETRTTLQNLTLDKTRVRVGEKLNFSFELTGAAREKLVVDYAVHYQLANDRLGRKVYKLASMDVRPGQTLFLSKTHAFRPITTRVYYPGDHAVEILVNGKSLGKTTFSLRT
jgi:3-methyladenine DNA glycosylase AlkC